MPFTVAMRTPNSLISARLQLLAAAMLFSTAGAAIKSCGLDGIAVVGGRSAVALSDGLLRSMSSREIAGILAHEMSHVRGGDMWVMGLAEVMSRMTSTLSRLDKLLLALEAEASPA